MSAFAPATARQLRPAPIRASSQTEELVREYFEDLRTAAEPQSNFAAVAAHLRERSAGSTSEDRRRFSLNWHAVHQNSRKPTRSVELDDRLLEKLERAHPVRRALAAIGPRDADLLEAAFEPMPDAFRVFGHFAGIAALTLAARRAHLESQTSRPLGEWLLRLAWRAAHPATASDSAASVTVQAIQRETEQLYHGAIARFARALDAYAALRRRRLQENR